MGALGAGDLESPRLRQCTDPPPALWLGNGAPLIGQTHNGSAELFWLTTDFDSCVIIVLATPPGLAAVGKGARSRSRRLCLTLDSLDLVLSLRSCLFLGRLCP